MSLIIIAIICLGIYYLYGFITDQETKRQRKNDPKRKESLEFYTTQANLFLQYKNYLYDNIDNLKKIKCNKCIGCSLCSYICPSKIEVREFVNIAKEKVNHK